MFAVVVDATGKSRSAVLAVLLFFISGAIVLTAVDVDAGRRAARRARPRGRPRGQTGVRPRNPGV